MTTSLTSARLVVKHPATAPSGGWEAMRLKVCQQGEPTNCIPELDCTNPYSAWNCTACSWCMLAGLQPSKQYNVEVRGRRAAPGANGTVWCVWQCSVVLCSLPQLLVFRSLFAGNSSERHSRQSA